MEESSILRYETSVFLWTLASPQPGTMRTNDKNFHYLASPLGSLLILILSSWVFFFSLSLVYSKAFSKEASRSSDGLRPSFCFRLLLFNSFPFLEQCKNERGHRCHSHSPWLLSSLSNFHPPIFSRVPERVSVITALRMDNSPVYSLLKFALLSGMVSDNREERQAFLSPRLSKRDFLFFFRGVFFFLLLCAFVVRMVLCEDNGFRQCLLFKRNRTAYDHAISKKKKKN